MPVANPFGKPFCLTGLALIRQAHKTISMQTTGKRGCKRRGIIVRKHIAARHEWRNSACEDSIAIGKTLSTNHGAPAIFPFGWAYLPSIIRDGLQMALGARNFYLQFETPACEARILDIGIGRYEIMCGHAITGSLPESMKIQFKIPLKAIFAQKNRFWKIYNATHPFRGAGCRKSGKAAF